MDENMKGGAKCVAQEKAGLAGTRAVKRYMECGAGT